VRAREGERMTILYLAPRYSHTCLPKLGMQGLETIRGSGSWLPVKVFFAGQQKEREKLIDAGLPRTDAPEGTRLLVLRSWPLCYPTLLIPFFPVAVFERIGATYIR
jgi:hypothetical protein